MQRRGVIQLFAAAAGLWATQQLPASAALLQDAAPAAGDSPDAPKHPLLPVFPLRMVLFPGTILALHIFEERYKEMIHDCLQNEREFGILLARDEKVKSIGCSASIIEVLRRYPDGRMDILVRGQRRFELTELNQEKSYLRGDAEFFEDEEDKKSEPPIEKLRQQAARLRERVRKLAETEEPGSNTPTPAPSPAASDALISFQAVAEFPADLGWKQSLLELRSERERLLKVNQYLQELGDYLERDPANRVPAGKA